MFTLKYFEDEFSDGNEVKSFDTYEGAYYAMIEQFDDAAADSGLCLPPDITNGGDIFGYDDFAGEWHYAGCIGEYEAHLEYANERWAIEETEV